MSFKTVFQAFRMVLNKRAQHRVQRESQAALLSPS